MKVIKGTALNNNAKHTTSPDDAVQFGKSGSKDSIASGSEDHIVVEGDSSPRASESEHEPMKDGVKVAVETDAALSETPANESKEEDPADHVYEFVDSPRAPDTIQPATDESGSHGNSPRPTETVTAGSMFVGSQESVSSDQSVDSGHKGSDAALVAGVKVMYPVHRGSPDGSSIGEPLPDRHMEIKPEDRETADVSQSLL